MDEVARQAVVGVAPIVAVLMEQDDEWATSRRYFT